MANAIILHRRRSEIIEPGSQTFTSNGVFVAPYTALYAVMLYGSAHKAGNGGSGGGSDAHAGGGGGGGGGGQSHSNFAVSCQCKLTKGTKIPVTVNENMVSLGSYASVATGTAAKNGGTGGSGYITSDLEAEYGEGGAGGAGEGPHSISVPGEYTTSGSNTGGAGGDGRRGGFFTGGSGGAGGYKGGGVGGHGDDRNGERGSGRPGAAAVIGKIEISWGGNE